MSALDMEQICRLCCNQYRHMWNLFEYRQEYPLSLPKMIYAILILEVDPQDGLPQKICSVCVTTLVKMYEIIQKYRENDFNLRKQLNAPMQFKIGDTMDLTEKKYHVYKPLDQESKVAEQMDETDVKQKANDENAEEIFAEWKPTEQNTEAKEPPLTKHDETDEEDSEDTDEVELKPTAQETEPPLKERKPKRGRSKVVDPNRPQLYDYKCYICKSESHETVVALLVHLRSNHMDLLPFTCSECVMDKVVFKTLLPLNAHLRQHLNPGHFEKCPYCDKRFITKKYVALHVQKQHPSTGDDNVQCPSKCEHCDEEYPCKVTLLQHVKLMHTASVSCVICGKTFKERSLLRKHIKGLHGQRKKFECHICKKELHSLKTLQSHLIRIHSKSNKVFKCSYCPKSYSTISPLRRHEKKHVENPNYVAQADWTEYYTIVEGEKGKHYDKKKKCNICGVVKRKIGLHLRTMHFPK